MDVAIQVEGLVRRYGGLVAVDNVSFTVRRGEIFGLLGPNGAGKTTTLEILETLRQPSAGRVLVDGLDALRQPWAVKRRIGVQLQAAGFYPDLTLVELLRFFAALYGVAVDPGKVLAQFSLEDKARVHFDRLSGGQKQRFALATALLHRPVILFLDEPTTGLDPQARVNLWELIREIHVQGVTVVLTTHYMEEAERLCDRLAIMDRGRIIATGTPRAMIDALLADGFKKPQVRREASLEDVFLHLTGKSLRDA
ncbi:MAG: ABC transporter ATP-binding protein [Chloroflexi bacterium]|nr:ABC transporter ATP-binding protein [Chloroflexota bacterium]